MLSDEERFITLIASKSNCFMNVAHEEPFNQHSISFADLQDDKKICIL
jgi:hypothetical protein